MISYVVLIIRSGRLCETPRQGIAYMVWAAELIPEISATWIQSY